MIGTLGHIIYFLSEWLYVSGMNVSTCFLQILAPLVTWGSKKLPQETVLIKLTMAFQKARWDSHLIFGILDF